MIDHIGYSVRDLAASKAFYDKALAPIGYRLILEVTEEMTGGHGAHAGFGDSRPDFWIGTGKPPTTSFHIAFGVTSRAQVDAFYKAAIEAGGRDNGKPGLRPEYHETYYGAFVLDPDGNNVEAVCHEPE